MIQLTYLENFDNVGNFHEGFPPYGYSGRLPCHPGGEDCNVRPKYQYGTADMITKVVPMLNVARSVKSKNREFGFSPPEAR